ncbi:MAG: PIN domain-containing protein [Roseibium sp.]|nr:PIN domain-containing protein [Roseibium sp.]
MELFRPVYLDTNIFILLGEGVQDERRAALLELVASQRDGEQPSLCTSELTLAELLVDPFRNGDEDLVRLYDSWIVEGKSWLTVHPVSRDLLLTAAFLRSEFSALKLPDAIHVSTAIELECSHILTFHRRLPSPIGISPKWFSNRVQTRRIDVVEQTPDLLEAIAAQTK